MIQADVHMHTNFSHDSESSPEQMVEGAIAKGLKVLCFTDHYDKDNTDWGQEDIFDPETYFLKMQEVREKYKEKIDIRIGVEIGLQPYLGDYYKEFVKKYPFDFVIGSVHSIEGSDVATKKIFQGNTDQEVYHRIFAEMADNIKAFDGFDTFGHMDYAVRYGEHQEKEYSYKELSDEIDEILRLLIERGKGLELNTAGLKYGLPFAHPCPDILKRYRELGGEMITIGADGHCPEHIAYDFKKAEKILISCGFEYYALFKDRKPTFYRLF